MAYVLLFSVVWRWRYGAFNKATDRVTLSLSQDHCYGLFGLLMMLAMKGGKRPTSSDGQKTPVEIIGPQGISQPATPTFSLSLSLSLVISLFFPLCLSSVSHITFILTPIYLISGIQHMVQTVLSLSHGFLNYSLQFTELQPDRTHFLGTRPGCFGWNPSSSSHHLSLFFLRNNLVFFFCVFGTGGWTISAYPLVHRVPCFGYVLQAGTKQNHF